MYIKMLTKQVTEKLSKERNEKQINLKTYQYINKSTNLKSCICVKHTHEIFNSKYPFLLYHLIVIRNNLSKNEESDAFIVLLYFKQT
mmetsp:Transcript_2866/g.3005  ORF Transcript_2866/g.3005 Transcript_2866/m.3005 type:complete len:87 (-) Transcript_2866:1446-1706(-)